MNMNMNNETMPVRIPDLSVNRRHTVDVAAYPVHYTYKTALREDTVSIYRILAEFLCRRLKPRDKAKAGILGMSQDVVTSFYRDHYGEYTGDSFCPAPDDLNYMIREWKKIGVDFGGMICCHGPEGQTPSASEQRFIAALLSLNPGLTSVLLGITSAGELRFFRFDRDFLRENT